MHTDKVELSDSSENKERIVRKRAEDLSPPSREEIERIDSIRDEDIDLSDIPEIGDGRNQSLICLRLDPETLESLRRRRVTADQIRELLRKHFGQRSDAA